jgi:phosphoribosylaminoimidazolecarboxamide formyltransferase/IMP cyclohydrolase
VIFQFLRNVDRLFYSSSLAFNISEIISTGGTFKLLQQNQINAKDISEFTGFPEIMDGRVKTLHPKVHGGLLGVLDNPKHLEQAKENQIESIDLLIINLYPFVETVAKTNDEDEIIENIEAGLNSFKEIMETINSEE